VSWRIRSIRRQAELKTETNRKIAELEQMALKAQMNPHFIFNSLNSIQHYMFDKDVESANRYITGFSRLIRLTLEFSSKTKISLEDEVRFLATYLELETKRFEGKFKYRIDVDAQLEPAHIFIPPMILQPYIENSIRHGIRYREDNNGMVKLDFNTDGDNLFISVEDNGVGRERSMQMKGQNNIEYQSKGMNLTARRIDMINKSSKFPISIDISDVHAGKEVAGTKVMIRIRLRK
jgi:LytS/YehU family sensor histidine kinase